MLQHKYTLYVGANNVTHKVDESTLVSLLNEKLDGYTLARTIGYWQGTAEESVVVTFISTLETEEVLPLAEVIREALEQQCVMVERHLVSIDFVSL
jgi:hypothetical protein